MGDGAEGDGMEWGLGHSRRQGGLGRRVESGEETASKPLALACAALIQTMWEAWISISKQPHRGGWG